ncbi:hypothetical protein A0J61_06573 [Choanephora cucurbitarum]|uniref:Uncharacterized protein n=1 Tax=Choanephora cucurbitarum TaxID=101091 RepID=A0A1C7N8I6_9FUNG|nr:hypothetical protein A0J61_06573 [Choanephora cucurbitarum]
MVHWDCDADLVDDHKTSNERLIEIILANEGELLKEWLGKGKGDGKKEPMLRTVLKEFHRQKAIHRRTTRDIRNAITQLLKKYEATKQLIQSAASDSDELMELDSNGLPYYPNGQDKFEASVKARFPFYFELQPYLENRDTKESVSILPPSPPQTSTEVPTSPPLSPSPAHSKRPVQPQPQQQPHQETPKRSQRSKVARSIHVSKRPLACKPQEEPSLMDLKKRRLDMEEHRILIEHQAKAIELKNGQEF